MLKKIINTLLILLIIVILPLSGAWYWAAKNLKDAIESNKSDFINFEKVIIGTPLNNIYPNVIINKLKISEQKLSEISSSRKKYQEFETPVISYINPTKEAINFSFGNSTSNILISLPDGDKKFIVKSRNEHISLKLDGPILFKNTMPKPSGIYYGCYGATLFEEGSDKPLLKISKIANHYASDKPWLFNLFSEFNFSSPEKNLANNIKALEKLNTTYFNDVFVLEVLECEITEEALKYENTILDLTKHSFSLKENRFFGPQSFVLIAEFGRTSDNESYFNINKADLANNVFITKFDSKNIFNNMENHDLSDTMSQDNRLTSQNRFNLSFNPNYDKLIAPYFGIVKNIFASPVKDKKEIYERLKDNKYKLGTSLPKLVSLLPEKNSVYIFNNLKNFDVKKILPRANAPLQIDFSVDNITNPSNSVLNYKLNKNNYSIDCAIDIDEYTGNIEIDFQFYNLSYFIDEISDYVIKWMTELNKVTAEDNSELIQETNKQITNIGKFLKEISKFKGNGIHELKLKTKNILSLDSENPATFDVDGISEEKLDELTKKYLATSKPKEEIKIQQQDTEQGPSLSPEVNPPQANEQT